MRASPHLVVINLTFLLLSNAGMKMLSDSFSAAKSMHLVQHWKMFRHWSSVLYYCIVSWHVVITSCEWSSNVLSMTAFTLEVSSVAVQQRGHIYLPGCSVRLCFKQGTDKPEYWYSWASILRWHVLRSVCGWCLAVCSSFTHWSFMVSSF